jgi:hypothetical protein
MRNLRRVGGFGVLALGLGLSFGAAMPAQAETMKECSVKFQAAKKDGTLNGADWKSFRAAQCGGGKATTPVAAAGAAPAVATTAPAAATSPAPAVASAPTVKPAATAAADVPAEKVGNATFPHAIDSKYASLSPGKGRMKTCVDQYKANKSSGGNGGMKWIQKGGGYYSACVKHMKAG